MLARHRVVPGAGVGGDRAKVLRVPEPRRPRGLPRPVLPLRKLDGDRQQKVRRGDAALQLGVVLKSH